MQLLTVFTREFRAKYFWLHFDEPSFFLNSQWRQIAWWVHVTFRVFLATYSVAWLVWTGVKHGVLWGQGALFLTYFSSWTQIVCTMYYLSSALATFYHQVIRTRTLKRNHLDKDANFSIKVSMESIHLSTENVNTEKAGVSVITNIEVMTPWYLRAAWLLYEISINVCSLETLCFWIFIQGKDSHFIEETIVNRSLLTTVILLLDGLIIKTPTHVLHVIYPIMFTIMYFIFNVTFSLLSNSGMIYSSLDWRRPMLPATAAITILVFVQPVLHVSWFFVYQFRLWLFRRYL